MSQCVGFETWVSRSFPFLYCGVTGRRGWYDCHTVGAEAFVQCSPMRLLPQMYANESVNGWCLTLPEAGVYSVGGTLLPYVYSAWLRPFRFTRL